MRKQTNKVSTGRIKKIVTTFFVIIFAIYFLYLVIDFVDSNVSNNKIIFDRNAIVGKPNPDKEYYYSSITSPTGYYVSLASNLYRQDDDSLMIYLTNPSINEVYFKCKIENINGDILYQTDILKPGEYLEKLKANIKLEDREIKIKIFILAYEIETNYSAGEVVINGVLY